MKMSLDFIAEFALVMCDGDIGCLIEVISNLQMGAEYGI